jgi:hypothetical protein
MVVNTETRTIAKTALRQALAESNGNTKDEKVLEAIANLQSLNPTTAPAQSPILHQNWLLISAPNFPSGEQLADCKFSYTLGRLAFNMFQPTKLKLVVDRVSQPVFLLADGETRNHDIVVEFTAIDDNFPQISGIVRNLATCKPISDKLLQAQFTGGTLQPQPTTNLETWQQIFGEQSQPEKTNFKDQIMSFFLKLMFGLVPPQTMNPETGEITFTMKRSPKGKLEIIYVDEEMRITKGEKGTVLVFTSI